MVATVMIEFVTARSPVEVHTPRDESIVRIIPGYAATAYNSG
jgi:hypothetical protein